MQGCLGDTAFFNHKSYSLKKPTCAMHAKIGLKIRMNYEPYQNSTTHSQRAGDVVPKYVVPKLRPHQRPRLAVSGYDRGAAATAATAPAAGSAAAAEVCGSVAAGFFF